MNNLITAVNKDMPLPPNGSTNLAGTKSILWEKIAVEPSQIAMKYDVSGNLTNDGVRSYYWNGEGMLVRVQGSGCGASASLLRADYGYDGLNRKVRSRDYVYTNSSWTLTRDIAYVYDGWNPVAEISATNCQLSKSYVWGLDLSGTLQGAGGVGGLLSSIQHQGSSIIPHFFSYDGNGNVVNLLDMSSGSISAHYEYDPFGRLICKEGVYADDNEYRFSTKRYNAAWSLYDYGYRHYSPDLGRWMSRDPIQSANLYIGLLNKPVLGIDRLGLDFDFLGYYVGQYLMHVGEIVNKFGASVGLTEGVWESLEASQSYQDGMTEAKKSMIDDAWAALTARSGGPNNANITFTAQDYDCGRRHPLEGGKTVGENVANVVNLTAWNAALTIGHYNMSASFDSMTATCDAGVPLTMNGEQTCLYRCTASGTMTIYIDDRYSFGGDLYGTGSSKGGAGRFGTYLGQESAGDPTAEFDNNIIADTVLGWGAPFDIHGQRNYTIDQETFDNTWP